MPLFRRCAAVLPALLLAACAAVGGAPWAPVEHELAGGGELAREGLTAGGRSAVVLAEADGRCPAPRVWRREAAGGWRAALAEPAAAGVGPSCPAVTAALAPDGGTLAVYDYGRGEATLSRLGPSGAGPGGAYRLSAPRGLPFPPPGPNAAFADGGRLVLLGAPGHACRRSSEGPRCGTAELAERTARGWRFLESFAPEGGAGAEVRFGQAVALSRDGSLVLVGGTGQPGKSGGLWLFARDRAGGTRAVAALRPDRDDPWFANDVSLSADGRWLAVGGERAVYLFEREGGEGFALRRRLRPPDATAGHFGETVALSGDGAALLVGAPRSRCDAGDRCGRGYLYRREGQAWALDRALAPARSLAEDNLGHRIAIDPTGRHAALQGSAALRVFDLPP